MKSHNSFGPVIQALHTALWVTVIFFVFQNGMSTAEASVGGRLQPAPPVPTHAGIWQVLTCERSVDWCWIAAVDPGLVCRARKSLRQVRRTFRAVARLAPNLTWRNYNGTAVLWD
jgi:hypothetical protein